MRALVTGGTGFLGRHVVERLRAAGHEVHVLARGPGATHVGSVLDRSRLAEAAQGCEVIFHLAGRVDRDRRSAPALRELHVDGTRAVLEVAGRVGARRVVYASTSGTVAVSRDPHRIATEDDSPPDPIVARWPYYATKLEAERVALALCSATGLPLICLNPSLLLGPGDVQRSSTGDVADVLTGGVPAIPSGGLSFVDVRDVADTFVAAIDRGRPGERYLLGAANWSLDRFVRRVAELASVKSPRFRAPDRATRWLARAADAVAHRVGLRSPIDPVSVEMSQVYWYLSSEKAVRELGFSPRDPDETLRDTIADLRAHGV